MEAVAWEATARRAGGRTRAGLGVHDLHVWLIGSGFPSLSAHVLVHEGDDCHGIRRELEQLLDERFQIEHTTLQVDHAPERGLLKIGDSGRHAGH